jgi:predicted ATPase/DNA-binding CsgD family transcriptional regulator
VEASVGATDSPLNEDGLPHRWNHRGMVPFGARGVGLAALTEREVEVLRAVGEHRSNRDIARLMHISERTVESHVSSLLRKLDATNRRALATVARRVASDDGPRDFRGLPSAWTSFLGRGAEVERVVTSLAEHRLVTVLGPGGIGKTRLAAEVASRVGPRLRGGGAFVDLVPVVTDQVEQAVAWSLGVAEQPGMPLAVGVEQELNVGPALVVLDNCEHVLSAVARWVEATLAACPDLVVLCTSRERLHVPGERVLVVPPMGDDARPLFLERAAENDALVSAGALDVDDLCRRLDGNPLAIELAAARLPSLGVDGLRSGLDDQLRLLSGPTGARVTSSDRHGSVRAVLAWSHDLLSEDERMAFRRLAVFAGVTDLDAATAVMPDRDRGAVADLVGRLTDKSLLHRTSPDDAATSRWRMMDTVRAYARDQLAETGERARVEDLRLLWAASAARQLEDALVGGGAWEERFGEIADDLRAALARDAPPDMQDARHSLGMSLGHVGYAHFSLTEAYSHYVIAAEAASGRNAAVVAWRSAAAVARTDQRLDRSLSCLEHAAATAESAGDRAAQARALADMARIMGRFPSGLANAPEQEAALELVDRAHDLDAGDDPVVAASIALAAAWNQPLPPTTTPPLAGAGLALAQQADDPVLISEALDALASAASFAGRHREAARLSAQRLDLLERMPRHEPEFGLEVFDLYHSITETALAAGDPSAAVSAARRSRSDPLYRAVPYHANSRLALALALLGEFDDAMASARDARDAWVRSGRPTAGWMANAFFAAALVEGLRGRWFDFDEWWALGRDLSARSSTNEMPGFVALRLELHTGRSAATILKEGRVIAEGRLGDYSRAVAGELATVREDADAAAQVPTFSENPYAAAFSERTLGRVERSSRRLDRAIESWGRLGARFERGVTLTLLPDRRREGERMLAELGCPPPASRPAS